MIIEVVLAFSLSLVQLNVELLHMLLHSVLIRLLQNFCHLILMIPITVALHAVYKPVLHF